MPKELATNVKSEKIINIISKFMIFQNIETDDIKKILTVTPEPDSDDDGYHKKIAKICQYKKGETVITEGDFDSWSFWVVKGIFDVIQDDIPIATFTTPGEIFGEMSVFEGIPRTASVIAITDSICLCMDMSIIDNLNDKKIETLVKKEFYSVILKRINTAKKRYEEDKRRLELKYSDLLDFENRIKKNKGL